MKNCLAEAIESSKLQSFSIQEIGLIDSGISSGISLKVHSLPFDGPQKEITLAIHDVIEKKRRELIQKYPEALLRPDGGRSYFESMRWDEIFCSFPDILYEIRNNTARSEENIISCAMALHPKNWIGMFWMLQYEKARAQLFRQKIVNKLLIPSEDDEKHQIEELTKTILSERARQIATKGGDAKAKKMTALKEETLRLYKLGTWTSAPEAAKEITPKIVAFSKGKGDLFATTTKPLTWIRAYRKSIKTISD